MKPRRLPPVIMWIIFIAFFIALQIMAHNIGLSLMRQWQINSPVQSMQISLFVLIIPLLGILLFSRFGLGYRASDLWLSDRKKGRHYLAGFFVGAGLFAAYMAIAVISRQLSPVGRGSLSLSDSLLFIPAFGIQSFEEELFSRGILQRAFKNRWGTWPSIMVPSLIFTILHIFNDGIHILAALNIFIVGIVFALMVYATDSLWLAGVAHAAWNYVQGPIFGRAVSGIAMGPAFWDFKTIGQSELVLGGEFGPEGSLVNTIILLLAAIYFYYRWQKRKSLSEVESSQAVTDQI